jgi:hypothetical protein
MKRLYIIVFILALLSPSLAWAASGTTSFSTCCLVANYTSTNGFIWFPDGRDVGTDYGSGTTGDYIIEVIDASGNIAKGDGGVKGSGTTNETIIAQDDCSADNTGDWTSFDATLAFNVDHYELTRTASSQGSFKTGNVEKHVPYVSYLSIEQGTSGGDNAGFYWSGGAGSAFGTTTKDLAATTAAYIDRASYQTALADVVGARLGIYTDINVNGEIINFKNFVASSVDTCGAKGIYVAWKSIDAGFDFDDASGYTVTIKKASKGAGPRSRVNRRTRSRR